MLSKLEKLVLTILVLSVLNVLAYQTVEASEVIAIPKLWSFITIVSALIVLIGGFITMVWFIFKMWLD